MVTPKNLGFNAEIIGLFSDRPGLKLGTVF